MIEDPSSDVSVTFARNMERAMAAAVTGRAKRELAPMLNELSLFTRASTFGDTNDLYYHAPSNRIGANYSPAAKGVLEQPAGQNMAKAPAPQPRYPDASLPRTMRGEVIDPAKSKSVAPAKEGFPPRGGSPDSPFDVVGGAALADVSRFTEDQRRYLADAIVRYYYYIEHGVREDETIAPPKEEWFERVLELVPADPPGRVTREFFDDLILSSLEEMRSDYYYSQKKSIVDYTLTNPTERERLQLQALEELLPVPGAVKPPHDELPVVWRANVEAAREDIAWTLQTLSPNVLELSALWEAFEGKPLVDTGSAEFKARLPFEAEDFRMFQTEVCERVKGSLWTTWVPKSAEIFRRQPPVCINGDTEAYYRSVASLQSIQLRGLVQHNLDAYVSFFDSHDPPDSHLECDPHMEKHKWSVLPAFVIRLREGPNGGYAFSPSFREVEDVVRGCLDQFVLAVNGIPCVGVAAVNPSRRGQHIPGVNLDDDAVTAARTRVLSVMERSTIAPKALAALFEPFLDLLTMDTAAYLRKFLAAGHTLEEYAEAIEEFRNKADAIKDTALDQVRAGAYLVNCTELKQTLVDISLDVANKLLDQVCNSAKESNTRICEAYTFMNAEVVKQPDTGDAVLQLKKYIQKSAAEQETLQAEIKANKAREEFLGRFCYDIPEDDFKVAMLSYEWPKKMVSIMKEATAAANAEHRAFEDALKKRRATFQETLVTYGQEIDSYEPIGDVDERENMATKVTTLGDNLAAALTESEDINVQERLFGWAPTKFGQVGVLTTKLEPYRKLWTICQSFFKGVQMWMNGPFSHLDPEQIEESVTDSFRNIYKLTKQFSGASGGPELPAPLSVAQATLEKLEAFKEYLPLIAAVCNPGLRDRHWAAMSDIIGIVGWELKKDDHTSLQRLIEKGVHEHTAKLAETSDFASREWSFEKTLDKMIVDWDGVLFKLKPWKDTGTFILEGGPVDEAQALLDDHIVKTQAMRASPFAKPFIERIIPWEAKLTRLQDIMDQWLKCQSKWLYLEPIFGSDEIMKQIPTEGAAFKNMDSTWRRIMHEVGQQPEIIGASDIINLLEDLIAANKELDVVEKGLNDFLDTKKLAFPRFFFLSNDELLEILSEAKDPLKVQPFMKKCFEAVQKVEFTERITMTHIVSVEGEVVPMCKEVDPAVTGAVEKWMLEFEDVMKESILKVTADSVVEYAQISREQWILKWPGQVVIAGSQIYWTQEVTEAIVSGGAKGLATYGEKSNKQLTNIVNMVRGELSKLERATMSALVTIDVHARDVVVQMSEDGVSDPRDFKWLSQLRYFWEDDTVRVRMINAEAQYGFEYLGNSSRLVITPLTDRCYRTLMGAIHLNLGGAPAGPAGTGKTETTKDLSKAIAIQCVVFNCSDGLDYKAMGKFFKGLAASGAWACFDEFNRIELEVLSVVAQQVLCIQRAVAARVKSFVFEGVELRLIATANVFITMNPGYAGRSELPDNLKALFRDVAMMVPDYAMIAEIILYSFGYLEARDMARKLVQTYRLCSEQLSSQDHYDYGMRAVISVLRAAGNLKRKFTDEREDVLMLRAITDVNLPKFLDQDVPLFKGILSDLFPGVELPEIDYDNLMEALRNNAKKANLQPLPSFFEKIIQLYEMIIVRHGLMIVGYSFGMKSSCISVLAGALGELKEKGLNGEQKVKYYCLNPKSITMNQLYGAEDPVSKEWADGILAVTFRNAARDTSPDRKWVVFDGPVDAIWIENMNTVLDDNKKLCLNSGEIVAMQGLMNMIFEVADLAVASPATVSRCGMVYVQPSLLGWRPTMISWLNTLPEGITDAHKEHITGMFDWLCPPCLRIATKMCKQPQPMQEINLVQSLMRLYESLLDEFHDPARIAEMNENLVIVWLDSLFLFALIWSLGASVDEEGRKKFDSMLRKLLQNDPPPELKMWMTSPAQKVTQLIPEGGMLVYDFMFDKVSGKWKKWIDTQEDVPIGEEATYTSIIVPTVDTIRYTFLIDTFVTHNKHFLFVGPTGTGKTAYIKKHVSSGIDPEKFSYAFMNFSAQTSANMTQDIIDGKLDKRKKGVFGPPLGKKMIVFVDDLNMPQIETYGAQPPIELLRQFMDYSGWYDRKELVFRKLIDMQFIAAMGPPGGGRNNVTNRYLRHFSLICATPFDENTMTKIFTTLVDWWMKTKQIPAGATKLRNPLVSSTIDLYQTVQRELLPTPMKSHYTFNLRDVSKVFQGICSTTAVSVEDAGTLTRLWVHESLRVFADRLTDDEDRNWFFNLIKTLTEKHFKDKFAKVFARLDANKNGDVDPGELRRLMFGDFMVPGADPKIYAEIIEYEKLYTVVSDYLGDFNATSKQPMQLVLFLFALEHVCRICRIIAQPGGHALLVGVGGSGRQSLTKLAAFMEEFEVFQIEISKSYGKQEWHDDLRKIMKMTGESNKNTVFLFSDTQINHEYFVEDISNILNTAEVPNLMEASDMVTIFENIRGRAKAAGMDGSKDLMQNFFISEVKRNLHIVLCFSPVGDAFRERLRKFPSLVTCTTIDWFSAWPQDALKNVAVEFLQEVNVEEPMKAPLAEMCVNMHSSVTDLSQRFLSEARRHFYVTPTSYLELISSYKDLLSKKQKEVATVRKRYEIGLEKLIATEESVAGMQEELVALQPELIKAGEETEAAMVVIAAETVEADKVKEVVAKEEAIASGEAAKVKAIKDECESDLAEAIPMLNAAVAALDTLTKNDITEVKGMKAPPAPVKLVMEAVCICKGLKPARVKDPNSGKMVEDFWETAKKMLMESDFLQSLRDYDKDNIPPAVITKIRPYVQNPDFDPELIKKASTAAYGLCCWVRAMEAYDRVAKHVGPKKIKLAEAEGELAEVMAKLKTKQDELQVVVDKINALNDDLASKKENKAKLEADVELCSVKLDRAQKLISGLGGEKVRWTAAAEQLGLDYKALTGDVLLSSGCIAYLGAFTATYREETCAAWVNLCQEVGIPCDPKYSLVKVLGDQVKIRQWNIQGLPKDNFSSENGTMVDYGRRWPLFIDPQGQANKWIRTMEEERGLLTIKLSDGDYMRTLENAVQFGKPVLLENIQESLDASLEPLLLKQTFKQGGAMCIRLGDATVEYSSDFSFYITTKLRNPHYAPELCTKVSLINFMITLDGLEDQLLGVVVAKERPDLAEEKNQLIIQGAANKKQLKEIEDQILKVLSDSEGNILEDEGAVKILSASKVLSDEISEKQKVADVTEAKIDETRAGYRPVAKHSSIVFFCVADMANIGDMYQYSLQWFTELFNRGIEDAEKSSDVPTRLKNIIEHFTFFLYMNVCRSLFEKDKLLFSFLVSTRISLADDKIDADELRFFLTGGISTGENAIPNPASEWLSEKAWGEVLRMGDLDTVKAVGDLPQDVINDPTRWKVLYDSMEPQNEKLPEPWHDTFTPLQRMMVIRAIRPDKVVPAITDYVGAEMGKRYVEPLPFNLGACFEDSSPGVPLVFVLSAGSDPMANLLKFAESKDNMRVEAVSLGQGQGPFAMKNINEGMEKGFWVVLQNCHLAKSFMPELELVCETKLKEPTVHKDFRLWLTAYPSPIFPITILENSVKMTNEAPKGLRAGLLRTYMSDPLSDPEFFNTCTKDTSWRKMVFGLAFFHSSMQERRKYGPIGFNIPYEFNENDLRISIRQLKMFLDEYEEVPYETLVYTCGECNYGGKVTDGHDRVTVDCILKLFYCPGILEENYAFSPSGLYKAPEQGDYQSYLDYINTLPLIAAPEVYGFHANADITKDVNDTEALLSSFMMTQSRDGGGGGKSPEEVIGEVAESLVARLPPNFDIEMAEKKYPVDYYESMNTVLTQELTRVNTLLTVIRNSLVNLGKAVKGLVLMSDELDQVGKSLYDGKVPALWLKKSFPSLKPLGTYVKEVIDRCAFFKSWVDDGLPVTFPLYAFFFTQAFLTGSKQNFARSHKIEIDKVDFDYTVLDGDESAWTEKPADGVYCFGMHMDGCAWSEQAHSLCESEPKVLYTLAPGIHMVPAEVKDFKVYNHYSCPLYKTAERRGILSTTGHSTNFVMDLRIPCDQDPSHWIRRGACMLLTLKD